MIAKLINFFSHTFAFNRNNFFGGYRKERFLKRSKRGKLTRETDNVQFEITLNR